MFCNNLGTISCEYSSVWRVNLHKKGLFINTINEFNAIVILSLHVLFLLRGDMCE